MCEYGMDIFYTLSYFCIEFTSAVKHSETQIFTNKQDNLQRLDEYYYPISGGSKGGC